MLPARLSIVWIVIATIVLAGCGANDGQQRAAFISFLQTRIVDKPGIHVPRLTDDERERLRCYAEH